MNKVHKILIGDGAEKYLPIALARIRWLKETFKHNMSQRYLIDGTVIHVATDALSGQAFLRIDNSANAGLSAYEFFVMDSVRSDPFKGKAVRVSFEGGGAIGYKLLGSNSDEYPPPAGKDLLDTPQELGGTTTRKILQQQGDQFYNRRVEDYEVYTVWRQSYPWYHPCYNGTAGTVMQPVTDLTYDLPLTVFKPEDSSKTVGDHGYTPDTDWYRTSTVRKVTLSDGKVRLFGIEIDYFGDVHVFPLEQPVDNELMQASPYASQFIKTNLAESKKQRVPFPDWCMAPLTPARDNIAGATPISSNHVPGNLSYQWEINSAGTRAAAVVLQEDSTPTVGVYNATAIRTAAATGTYAGQHRANAYGLLEISIDIEAASAELDDYTVSVGLLYASQPFVDERWFVRTAYASSIIDPSLDVAKDTLLSLELELLGEQREDPDDDTIIPSPFGRYVVKRAKTEEVLFSFPFAGYGASSESEWMGARFVSCDLPTLSFILEARAFVAGDAEEVVGIKSAPAPLYYENTTVHGPLFEVTGGMHVRVIVRGARRTDLEVDRGPHASLAASLLDQPVFGSAFRMPCGFLYTDGPSSGDRNYVNQWESYYFWGELQYMCYSYGAFGRGANNTDIAPPQTAFFECHPPGVVTAVRGGVYHEYYTPHAFAERDTRPNTTFWQWNAESNDQLCSARVMCDSYRAVLFDTFAVDISQSFFFCGDSLWSICAGPFVWYNGECTKHAVYNSDANSSVQIPYELGGWQTHTAAELGPGLSHLSDWQQYEMIAGSRISPSDLKLSAGNFESTWIDVIEHEDAAGRRHVTSHLTAHQRTGGVAGTHTDFAQLSWRIEKNYFARSYHLEALGSPDIGTGFFIEAVACGPTPNTFGNPGTCSFIVHDSGSTRDHGIGSSSANDYGQRLSPHAVTAYSNLVGFTKQDLNDFQMSRGTHSHPEIILNIIPHLKSGAIAIGKFERKK